MRASVVAAWPAMCSRFEGRCWWIYLDVKKLPTTGLGILLETVEEAQSFPWFRVSDGLSATADEIAAEYKRVKALTRLAPLGGFSFRPSAQLRLPEAEIDRQLMATTELFWAGLRRRFLKLEQWPADAQLAAMDLIWQNGAGFTDKKERDGSWTWPNMRAAFAEQDWTKAAAAVPGSGARADTRKRLFRNAAKVVKLGIDRDILWNTKVPVADVIPADPPVIIEPGIKPKHGSKSQRAYVTQYGELSDDPTLFLTTTRTRNMWLEAVRLYHQAGGVTRPYWTQGGYNAGGRVSASAGTHDGDACDTSIKAMTGREKKLWELATWIVGFAGWIRLKLTNVWPEHWHGIPKGGALSAGANGQVTQFRNARNGLFGAGMYSRIARMGVGKWTWEDYLAGWGVSLSALLSAFDSGEPAEDVKDLQWALSKYLGTDVIGDGQLGPQTKAALAKVGPFNQDTLIKLGLEVTP